MPSPAGSQRGSRSISPPQRPSATQPDESDDERADDDQVEVMDGPPSESFEIEDRRNDGLRYSLSCVAYHVGCPVVFMGGSAGAGYLGYEIGHAVGRMIVNQGWVTQNPESMEAGLEALCTFAAAGATFWGAVKIHNAILGPIRPEPPRRESESGSDV